MVVGTHGQITAPIPLLNEEPGFRFNSASEGAPVKLEAFIELVCSDSAYAFPVLQEVQNYYGAANLDLVFQTLSLPYHRQAWFTTQGTYQVEDKAPEALFDYMQIMLDNINQTSNANTEELSEVQMKELIGAIQEETTGIPAEEFASSINSYGSTSVRTWKYATRRGMAGTPWFVLNGIDLAVNPNIRLSFEDWRAILDPLIPSVKSKKLSPVPAVDTEASNADKIKTKNTLKKKLLKSLNAGKNH